MLSIQAEFDIFETSSTHQVVQLGFLLLELPQHVLGGNNLSCVYQGNKDAHLHLFFHLTQTGSSVLFWKLVTDWRSPPLPNSYSQNCLIIWIFSDNNVVPPPPKKQTADLSIKWIKVTNPSPDLLLQLLTQTPSAPRLRWRCKDFSYIRRDFFSKLEKADTQALSRLISSYQTAPIAVLDTESSSICSTSWS